jgi:hypothetical protein
VLEAGERRGRLLWERRLPLALVDGVAVAAAFLIAFNLRSAEIRPEFFCGPRLADPDRAVDLVRLGRTGRRLSSGHYG